MTEWAIILFWVLVGLAAGQVVAAVRFAWIMRRARLASKAAGPCPKTAVILCLRGSDPFLAACLDAILHQDYPCYDLRIVVDSRDDPAWKTAEQTIARCGAANVQMQPLTSRRPTCSLKCSSLVQAASELDASYEVIALLDADTIPHRTWLRELVAPLADERVGAATGNRWYMPASQSWGSLTRWLWNAAAVVHMYVYRIPWGGTLALKAKILRESDLLDRWAHAFCEDTMLFAVLRRLGYRIAFVPSLMMVNREACSLTNFFSWMRRQMLTVRLYHPAWALVIGQGVLVSVIQAVSIALLGAALAKGQGLTIRWLVAGMTLYWGAMIALLITLETTVRRTLAARGEPTAWLKVSSLFRVGLAMLLTQVIYLAALVSALFLRTVEWRGVWYRVDGPNEIRVIEYERRAACPEPAHALESL
jgi:cellulose synthase/poly-beta-1,6-N-acetylglucosamine synthase-like glycosyltransferase